jgi:hypothetical protein
MLAEVVTARAAVTTETQGGVTLGPIENSRVLRTSMIESASARQLPGRPGRDGLAPLVRTVIDTRRRFGANQPPQPASPAKTLGATTAGRGERGVMDPVR